VSLKFSPQSCHYKPLRAHGATTGPKPVAAVDSREIGPKGNKIKSKYRAKGPLETSWATRGGVTKDGAEPMRAE
jgi:hypothetical protein